MTSPQSIVHSPQKKNIFLATCYLLLATILLHGCQGRRLYKDTRIMMGTFVEVVSPDKRAAEIAFREIKRIEGLLSKYKEDSEIMKLNNSGRIMASPETFYVIKKAKEFWQDSDGAFDITIGPLMDLWGFSRKDYRIPPDPSLQAALQLVGSDKIVLNAESNVIELKIKGMKIDLGAIAKGYAIDCAVNKLKKAGINSCLLNAGGDIYCLGDKFGRPWRVAVRNPDKKDFQEYLELTDKAVATSGDYEQYFIKNNRRYSHIFDPRTGYPVDGEIASVSVTAPDCLSADTLATAIFVLGKEKGSALLKKFPRVTAKIYETKELK